MPAERWTTSTQRDFLLAQLPAYMLRQADKKYFLFWGRLQEDWYTQFPEEAVLGFPLPTDPDARRLTEAEAKHLAEAKKTRNEQLKSWFRRAAVTKRKGHVHASKTFGNSTSAAMKVFVDKVTGKKRHRVHQHVEIFQSLYPEEITTELELSGWSETHELARQQALDPHASDETLEEQQAAIKQARSERMRMRRRVAERLLSDASEEVRERVEQQLEDEKEKRDHAKSMPAADEDENGERTPEQYQDGIDASEEIFLHAHKTVEIMGGMVGLSIFGAPFPEWGGGLGVKVMCFGATENGNNFREAHAEFEQAIAEPFNKWLQRCFPPAVRLRRAFPTDNTDSSNVERTAPTEPDPPPAAPKAKRKRAPRKKKKNPVAEAPAIPAEPAGSVSSHIDSAVTPAATLAVAGPPMSPAPVQSMRPAAPSSIGSVLDNSESLYLPSAIDTLSLDVFPGIESGGFMDDTNFSESFDSEFGDAGPWDKPSTGIDPRLWREFGLPPRPVRSPSPRLPLPVDTPPVSPIRAPAPAARPRPQRRRKANPAPVSAPPPPPAPVPPAHTPVEAPAPVPAAPPAVSSTRADGDIVSGRTGRVSKKPLMADGSKYRGPAALLNTTNTGKPVSRRNDEENGGKRKADALGGESTPSMHKRQRT
ncbi:hypothetical protein C8F01DRAFT_1262804 [Mycena amicta]|nr:hypothetical protein C8F01DRAFT_1262804 [Mycena amicta]